MSEHNDPTPTVAGEQPEPGSGRAPRPPSPGAQAASRARRIGGRPTPGPRPGAAPAAATEPTSAPRAAAERTPDRPASAERVRGGFTDRAAGHPRLRRLPAILAGLLAAALAAACVVDSHGLWWGRRFAEVGAETRVQVLASAKSCVGAVVSYDYRTLDASKRAGLACVTGTFADQYRQAMDKTVTKLAPASQTVQTFQVANAGVQRVSPDGAQWVVLVYGQQAVTNTTTGKDKPRLDVLSIQATLQRVRGKWLLTALQEVS